MLLKLHTYVSQMFDDEGLVLLWLAPAPHIIDDPYRAKWFRVWGEAGKSWPTIEREFGDGLAFVPGI